MTAEIIDYIRSQSVGVFAIQMLDGSPHGATVHFAYDEESARFYFQTYREYRKCEALFGREESKATFVIGTDDSNMKTLQIDGIARLIKTPDEETQYEKIYFGKFPKKARKASDPNYVYFMFTPTWWRFTDWTVGENELVLSSEDKR